MAVCRRISLSRVALSTLSWVAAAAVTHPVATLAQATVESQALVQPRTYVATDYSYVSFQGDTDPWQLASLSLGRRGVRGSLIARANYARRFGITGTQIELDAYPQLGRSMYGYVNAGYSGVAIFPKWRYGAELFANLPGAWEGSAGFRQLRFGGPPVNLYTGSVGKYLGNYWFSLRPYLRSKEGGTSLSAGLTGRRYFADADHYVGARVSYGTSPSDQITPQSIERINSLSVGVQGSGGPWTNVVATWSAGHDREELAPGQIRRSWPVSLGLMFIF